ncbi:MAG: citramalate synthase [Thermosulfidibacteraceae bacterium]|jgi:2-isopropylmalate synthase
MVIEIYDTTLRDGTQGEEVSFSSSDKLLIAERLDDLGVHYIEGGWPGSNPKDMEFFGLAKKVNFKNAKISAFGSTRRPGISVEKDSNIIALLRAETQVVAIFGKSWDLHVTDALRTTLDENLNMIYDSVKLIKKHDRKVIYDAEHFFDGYKRNPEYALKTIKVAEEAGADVIVLCDTNGGSLPFEVEEIVRKVREVVSVPLGIHCHNDTECAVANSIAAVRAGVVHVQGTINGLGERCGNANLCSIIPNLELKMGYTCVGRENLKKLTSISRFVYELANLKPWIHQPYVGRAAFAHKGGVHVSAVMRNPSTYEHIEPELVGNVRRVLISDLSGKSNIIYKAQEFGVDLSTNDPLVKELLDALKNLEYQGYQFEGAEASFEILVKKALRKFKPYFDLRGFRVIVEKRGRDDEPLSEATVKVETPFGSLHVAAEGNGPVNALDKALRKALEEFYPNLAEMHLVDYKVRILDEYSGTAAKVRVLIESTDGKRRWGTVGVHENIIEASWRALVDSIEYKLMKDEKDGRLIVGENNNK